MLDSSRKISSGLRRPSGGMRPSTDAKGHDAREPSLLRCTLLMICDFACQLPRYSCAPGLGAQLRRPRCKHRGMGLQPEAHEGQGGEAHCRAATHFVGGSPMCTAFSAWQHINRAKRPADIVEHELVAGRVRLAWCYKLYRGQIKRGAFSFCMSHVVVRGLRQGGPRAQRSGTSCSRLMPAWARDGRR